MKKRIMCLVLAASLAATMAGCGKQNAGSTAENKSDDKSAHKIALITDTIGTEQFILQAYHEMEKLSELFKFFKFTPRFIELISFCKFDILMR